MVECKQRTARWLPHGSQLATRLHSNAARKGEWSRPVCIWPVRHVMQQRYIHSANTPNLAIDSEGLTRYATDEPKPARLLLGSRSKWHVMSAPVHQSWATCHPPPRTGHNIARTCMNDTRRVHLHIHTDVRAHTNTHTHTHASLRRTYGH